MQKRHVFICVWLLQACVLEAAIVVTHRGSAPNVFEPFQLTDRSLDIDGDAIADFRFYTDGLQAILVSLGTNRFVGFADPMNLLSDEVVPISFGHYITPEGPFPDGQWRQGTDNGNSLGFLLGYADSGRMQLSKAYIAVEFQRATGTHYGWIQYEGFSVHQFPFLGPNGEILGYVDGIDTPGGVVDSWGWETTPGIGIQAGVPEPGRGVLMLVAVTITLLRRRRVS